MRVDNKNNDNNIINDITNNDGQCQAYQSFCVGYIIILYDNFQKRPPHLTLLFLGLGFELLLDWLMMNGPNIYHPA
jgi:hypothetical protein